MKRLPPIVLTLLLAAVAGAEGPQRLPVDEAGRIALAHQPSLAAARASVDAAHARTRQAWSALLPSVTGSFVYNPQTANFAATPAFARLLAGSAISTGSTTMD